MHYYYFELFINGKLFSSEVFSTESEEQSLKYFSYKEQALREINYSTGNIITSKNKKVKIHNVTDAEIKDLESNLIEISEYRGKIVEKIRVLNNFKE
jgi:hypothetical protein